ncbi:MAG: nucleotidyl transferase AbiEii/AbiGii toxin family protein [Bryobacterales bacterium]|nr:nucleotidyl transferase AbiEii/AbiGii toxin family protein [Bryobacterales bacterium]
MERFLYRLAKSPFADRFILKGALLLTVWRAPVARPTMDIDLAGKTNNELEHIRSLVGEVCEFATESDGIEFTAASIEVQRIKEDAEYEGVRVRFPATLAKARIPMQIDIGFGDVIVPRPIEISTRRCWNFRRQWSWHIRRKPWWPRSSRPSPCWGSSTAASRTITTSPCWRGCTRLTVLF